MASLMDPGPSLRSPFSEVQLADSLPLPFRSLRHCLCKTDSLGERLLDTAYEAGYFSRFEVACRKIFDKRAVSNLPQHADVLHKHSAVSSMPGKGDVQIFAIRHRQQRT